MKKLVLCDRLEAVSTSCVQVNSLDQLHVVEQGAERHEVRKADFVSLCHLQDEALSDNQNQVSISTNRNQVVFNLRCQ